MPRTTRICPICPLLFVTMLLAVTVPYYVLVDTIPRPTKAATLSRADFARRMSKVKEGMSKEQVVALVGKPDDIRTQYDPGGIWAYHAREIWRYGTNGHLTFPTLGQIYIGDTGNVLHVFGVGEPTSASWFTEPELRTLLRAIDKATQGEYNPLSVIRAVNTLQPLGKDRALAAFNEYLRVANPYATDARDLRLFLVLRALFDVPTESGYMPLLSLGVPEPSTPFNPRLLLRFPLLLIEDIPLMAVKGFAIAGFPEPIQSDVRFFQDSGILRSKPLRPTDHPLEILEALQHSRQWLWPSNQTEDGRIFIMKQLLALIGSQVQLDTDGNAAIQEAYWEQALLDVSAQHLRWSPKEQRYLPTEQPRTVKMHVADGGHRTSHTFVYAPNGDSRSIGEYEIDSHGKRHPLAPPLYKTKSRLFSLTADPTGRFLYAPAADYTYVMQFKIGPDGVLTPMNPPDVQADSHPTAIVIHPNGRFAYVSCSHGDICQYRINRAGALIPLSPEAVAVERDPSAVQFDETGQFATVYTDHDAGESANSPLSDEFTFRVNRNGTLTRIRIHGTFLTHGKSGFGGTSSVGVRR